MAKIQKGNKVSIEYTGTYDNGEVFDSSKGKAPLVFVVGSGMVIPGFDKAVDGMSKGDSKKFKIPAAEAYGERNEALIKAIPKPASFPSEAKEGMIIGVGPSAEMQVPALIVKLTDTEVTLDLNHPLAGKNLNFEIKVVDVEEGDFLSEMHECSCGCEHENDLEHECGCDDSCENKARELKNEKSSAKTTKVKK